MHFFQWACCVGPFFWSFALAAAPVVSPATAVSVPARGATGGAQDHPVVAASLSGFLYVWLDHPDPFLQSGRLLGLRAGLDGQPLDSAPFLICESTNALRSPAIVSDGTNFLVSWLGTGLYLSFIRASGGVFPTNGIRLDTSSTGSPIMSGGAEGFLLIWKEWYSYAVRGARISSAGNVLDPAGVLMDLPWYQDGVLGSDGSNYVYVAADYVPATSNYATFRWRIAQANASVSSRVQIAPASDSGQRYALAFNGSKFLLSIPGGATNQTMFLNADGTFLGLGPSLTGYATWIKAASQNGDFILLAGSSYESVPLYRLSSAGTLLQSNQISISAFPYDVDVSLAAGPQRIVIFYREPQADDVLALVMSTNGILLGKIAPQGPNHQSSPSVASDGSGYLVAWQENRDGSNLVYAATVTMAGGFSISTPILVGSGEVPRVAYSGGAYLIVWLAEAGATGRRLSKEGAWLDTTAFTIATNVGRPAVAGSGTNFYVTWHYATNSSVNGLSYVDIYGRTVATNGELGAVARVSDYNPRVQLYPEVAFSGSAYIVTWYAYTPPFGTIMGKWVKVATGGQPSGLNEYISAFQTLVGQIRTNAVLAWSSFEDGNRVAKLDADTSLAPPNGLLIPMGIRAMTGHRENIWLAGFGFLNPNPQVASLVLMALDSGLGTSVPLFELQLSADSPAMASNGTNILCAFETSGSAESGHTPRVQAQLVFPETTLQLRKAATLRLAGVTTHGFLIERSPDLNSWQPFYTNSLGGEYDIPAYTAPKQFFRLKWHSSQ